ncbi:hypothetical protein ACFLRA_02840 [Bdellovibrionota bacterium]
MKSRYFYLCVPVILFLSFSASAGKEVMELFGRDGESYEVTCPETIKIKLPTYDEVKAVFGKSELPSNKEEFNVAKNGVDGSVESLEINLSLSKMGAKRERSGSCYYSVEEKGVGFIVDQNEKLNPIREKMEKNEKPLFAARAYRRYDQSGVQVVGLTVPLKAGFSLQFKEIPFAEVFEKKDEKYEPVTRHLRAEAKISNNLPVRGESGQTFSRNFDFGEIALLVSLVD